MRHGFYVVLGVVFIWLGHELLQQGGWSQFGDFFPTPPLAGWLVIAWGALIVAYGLWKLVKTRKKDGER